MEHVTNGFLSNSAYVFIASPRSASNYICNIIVEGASLSKISLKTEQGFGRFSVDLNKRENYRSPFIWYQHLFPTSRNIDLVKKLSIGSPIITYREPMAWVLSSAEWCERSRSPWGIEADSDLVAGYIERRKSDGLQNPENSDVRTSLSAAIDFVIDFELPMYVRFLNGWVKASETDLKELGFIFLDYDSFFDDMEPHLNLIAERWERFSIEKAKSALNKSVNFNVGRERDHRSFFCEDQISRINSLLKKSAFDRLSKKFDRSAGATA